MHIEVWTDIETGKVKIREPYKVIDWTLPEQKGEYDGTASSYRTKKTLWDQYRKYNKDRRRR